MVELSLKSWWGHSGSRMSAQIEPENHEDVIFFSLGCHYINVLNINGPRKTLGVSNRIKNEKSNLELKK